jgi:uncharacterized SAM-binding protein YcdF (DUF218 family)
LSAAFWGTALRRRGLLVFLLLLITAIVTYAGRPVWLPVVGEFLVVSQAPETADIVVVLAGDIRGDRILRAVELVQQGHAPRILVDGSMEVYGAGEADLATTFALQHGASREIFEPFPMEADSTLEEAQIVDAELAGRGVRKALVVTSNFHTRRALRIFEAVASGKVKYVMVAAPSPDFQPDRWWYTRAGKRTLLLEYLKTLNSWYELTFAI